MAAGGPAKTGDAACKGAPGVGQAWGEAAGRASICLAYGESSAQARIDATDDDRVDVGEDAHAIDDLRALANEAPVIRLVSMLLTAALDARASDVLLEAYRSEETT